MRVRYPYIRCEETGEVKPGYALCPHLAMDISLPIGDVTAATKRSMGVMVCQNCAMQRMATIPLILCCGRCIEDALLQRSAMA